MITATCRLLIFLVDARAPLSEKMLPTLAGTGRWRNFIASRLLCVLPDMLNVTSEDCKLISVKFNDHS